MKQILWLALALALPVVAASAQDSVKTEKDAVLLAAAGHLGTALKAGGKILAEEFALTHYQGQSPRVLVPEVLAITFTGIDISRLGKTTTIRDSQVTRAMAALLEADIATPADTIWCKNGCHGTMGTEIRFNEPSVTGDSAVVVYRLFNRNEMGPGRSNKMAVVLRKTRGEWRVTWTHIANAVGRILPLADR